MLEVCIALAVVFTCCSLPSFATSMTGQQFCNQLKLPTNATPTDAIRSVPSRHSRP